MRAMATTESVPEFRRRAARPGWRQHLTDDLRRERIGRPARGGAHRRAARRWQATLAADRWVAITWPTEYGGRGASIAEQIAYVEEMSRADAPEIINNLGIGIVGPPILAYGTEEQKQRFAPRILNAEDLWCCGFSEPGAGSDLASLRTKAMLDGDTFVAHRPEGVDDATRSTPTGAWCSAAPIPTRPAATASRVCWST